MSDPSHNSFIPKQNPIKKAKRSAPRQIFILTIISYVLVFATIIAVASIYFYSRYIDQQLNDEISALNTEINSFNTDDMQAVLEFDNRLQQADGRLQKNASVAAIFQALEAITVDTAQIDHLNLERLADEAYTVKATVVTDSFDSTIFQRGVYIRNQIIDEVTISNIKTNTVVTDDVEKDISTKVKNNESQVYSLTFLAELDIPLSMIPYQVVKQQVNIADVVVPTESSLDNGSSTTENSQVNIEKNNEENI